MLHIHKPRLLLVLLGLLVMVGLASAQKQVLHPNEKFASSPTGAKQFTWAELDAIQSNVSNCLRDGKLDTPVCKTVQARLNSALFQALILANIVNSLSEPSQQRFCDDHGKQLVFNEKNTEATIYALQLVSERVKYASSIYGSDLGNTYTGKFIYDYLVESKPCKAGGR
jgi:hypothetical protein